MVRSGAKNEHLLPDAALMCGIKSASGTSLYGLRPARQQNAQLYLHPLAISHRNVPPSSFVAIM
jgi:hypothetical protein